MVKGKAYLLLISFFLLSNSLSAVAQQEVRTEASLEHRDRSVLCRVFFVPGAYSGDQGWTARLIRSGEYFSDYLQYFSQLGCQVKVGMFLPDQTIEERALMLKDQVERFWHEGRPSGERPLVKDDQRENAIHLIAHSQGGLDARFALRALKMKGVHFLATIGTPHHGTPVADWAFKAGEKGSLVYWLLKKLGGYDLKSLRFVAGLRSSFLERFQERFEKVENVRYVSATGNCRTECHWGLRFLAWWTGVGPGDGLVPAESQKFGEDLGEFDLDHISEIAADPKKKAERQRLMFRLRALIFDH